MPETPVSETKQPEAMKTSRFHELAQIVRKKISGWKKHKQNAGQPTA